MIDCKKEEEEEEEEESHQTFCLAVAFTYILFGWILLIISIEPIFKVIFAFVLWGSAYVQILSASYQALRESAQLFGNDPQMCGKP